MIERDDLRQDLHLKRISGKPQLRMKDALRFRTIDESRRRKRFLKQRYSIATSRQSAKSDFTSLDNEELAHEIMKKIPKSNRQWQILVRLLQERSQEQIAEELGVSPALICIELKDIKRRSRRLME